MILSLIGERRAGDLHLRHVEGDIGLPHDLAGGLVGGDDAGRRIGGRDDEIAPQGGAAVDRLPLLLGLHAPDDPAGIARGGVDLVEHAPGIGDVEEAVLRQRRRLVGLVAGAAAERDRIGELEVLDVALVDPVEGREPLAVIAAVVHQPVLRLLVGIEEPFRRRRRPRRCWLRMPRGRRCQRAAGCASMCEAFACVSSQFPICSSAFALVVAQSVRIRRSPHLSPLAGRGRRALARRVRGPCREFERQIFTLRIVETPLTPTLAPQAGRGGRPHSPNT